MMGACAFRRDTTKCETTYTEDEQLYLKAIKSLSLSLAYLLASTRLSVYAYFLQ